MTEEETKRLIAVMKSYERKSKLPHYDMWSKFTGSYDFKVEELNYVTMECPRLLESDALALDAGCGFGVYSSMLSNKGYRVVSLDVSVGMLKKTRKLMKKDDATFIRGSITHFPFKKGRFDLILCLDTLHHLTDNNFDKTLCEFRRIAKTDGLFIMDTRNALNPIVFVRYRMTNMKWAKKGGLTLIPRSLNRVERKLKECGFKPVKSRSIGFLVSVIAPYIVVISRAFGKTTDKGKQTGQKDEYIKEHVEIGL